MILFTILHQNKLKILQKRFNFQFSEQIWRVLPHTSSQRNEWVLELRNPNSKSVHLAAIDPIHERLLWQTAPIELDWWSSLVMVREDQIFVHLYRYPEIPEPTDIIVFSLENGNLLYHLPNHFLVGTPSNGLAQVARRVGEELKYYDLDASTGSLSKCDNPTENEILSDFKLPNLQKNGDPYFDQMRFFIESLVGHGALHSIEYLDLKPYMMFSYYIYEQEKMNQFILVANQNKEIIVHDLVNEGEKSVGVGTMILKANVLVYLKNKNEFSSLKLS